MRSDDDESTDYMARRIRTRAARIAGGAELLEIASRETVIQEMAEHIRAGRKPVLALTKPLIAALGLNRARNDSLRQLAGEVTAWVAEQILGAVRVVSGVTREIKGDGVFTSATPFRFGDRGGPAPDPVADAIRSIARKFRNALTDAERAIFIGIFAEPTSTT